MGKLPLLQDAIDFYKAGKKKQSIALLKQIISEDPKNELAWLWLSACTDKPNNKRLCFLKVLQINPNNAHARKALEQLEARSVIDPTPPSKSTQKSFSQDQTTQASLNLTNNPAIEATLVPAQITQPKSQPGKVCPECGQLDKIAKVTSIVSAGTSKSFGQNSGIGLAFTEDGSPLAIGGGNSTSVSVTESVLSARLSPPPKPVEPSDVFYLLIVFLGIGILFSIVCIVSTLQPEVEAVLVIAMIGIFLTVIGAFGVKRKIKNKEKYKIDYTIWRSKIEKWSQLYYCARDDIVFDPVTMKYASVESLWEFLNVP